MTGPRDRAAGPFLALPPPTRWTLPESGGCHLLIAVQKGCPVCVFVSRCLHVPAQGRSPAIVKLRFYSTKRKKMGEKKGKEGEARKSRAHHPRGYEGKAAPRHNNKHTSLR